MPSKEIIVQFENALQEGDVAKVTELYEHYHELSSHKVADSDNKGNPITISLASYIILNSRKNHVALLHLFQTWGIGFVTDPDILISDAISRRPEVRSYLKQYFQNYPISQHKFPVIFLSNAALTDDLRSIINFKTLYSDNYFTTYKDSFGNDLTFYSYINGNYKINDFLLTECGFKTIQHRGMDKYVMKFRANISASITSAVCPQLTAAEPVAASSNIDNSKFLLPPAAPSSIRHPKNLLTGLDSNPQSFDADESPKTLKEKLKKVYYSLNIASRTIYGQSSALDFLLAKLGVSKHSHDGSSKRNAPANKTLPRKKNVDLVSLLKHEELQLEIAKVRIKDQLDEIKVLQGKLTLQNFRGNAPLRLQNPIASTIDPSLNLLRPLAAAAATNLNSSHTNAFKSQNFHSNSYSLIPQRAVSMGTNANASSPVTPDAKLNTGKRKNVPVNEAEHYGVGAKIIDLKRADSAPNYVQPNQTLSQTLLESSTVEESAAKRTKLATVSAAELSIPITDVAKKWSLSALQTQSLSSNMQFSRNYVANADSSETSFPYPYAAAAMPSGTEIPTSLINHNYAVGPSQWQSQLQRSESQRNEQSLSRQPL